MEVHLSGLHGVEATQQIWAKEPSGKDGDRLYGLFKTTQGRICGADRFL